jgi:phosphomannomutase
MAAVMTRARQTPPSEIIGLPVSAVIDLADSSSSGAPSFDPRVLPASDVVMWELGEHGRIALRPSGTEPKLKLYVDTCCRPVQGEAPAATRARAHALLDRIADAVRARLDI